MSFLQTTNSHGQQQVLLDNARMEHQGHAGQHAGHGQGGSSNEFSRPPTLSESEMYRRVFHVKKPPLPPPPPPSRREDLPLDVTNSKSMSSLLIAPSPPPPAPTQLAPASPGPVTLLAPSDLDAASLKAALPYIPPHADYTIIQGKYEAAYHKNAPPPKKRSSKPGKAKNNKTKKKPTTSDPTKTGQPSAASRKQSKVLAVAEWKFPTNDNNSEEGTKKTWDFLFSEIAKGRDAQFVPTATAAAAAIAVSATNHSNNPGRPTGTDRRGIKRKQSSRTSVLDENGVPIWNSLATNVEFDPRYLQYDNSPYGSLDQLVRPSVIVADPCSGKDDALSEAYLQSVPDPPFYLTKTSRVGVSYQARVCRHKEDYHDKRNGSYLPEYEALWDPVLANKAEKDGQDIDGFLLGSNMTLSEREMKMKLLHVCDYNVADAQEEYNRIRGFGWEEDTSWSDEEKEKLKGLLETLRLKDFNYIAKEMKRSRSDCLVYYYRWKRTSRVYPETKKTWKHWHRSESKNDYCTLCDDGGSLMVLCDRCDCAYHLSCLDPPLSVIPEGDWFCPKCISKKLSQEGGGYISLAPRSSPASILWTSPARRAALGRETNRDTKPPPPPVAASRDLFRSSMPGLARRQMARESASPAAGSRSGGSRLAGTGRVPALPLVYRSPGQESSTQASIADSPFVLSDEESSSVFSEPADV